MGKSARRYGGSLTIAGLNGNLGAIKSDWRRSSLSVDGSNYVVDSSF